MFQDNRGGQPTTKEIEAQRGKKWREANHDDEMIHQTRSLWPAWLGAQELQELKGILEGIERLLENTCDESLI